LTFIFVGTQHHIHTTGTVMFQSEAGHVFFTAFSYQYPHQRPCSRLGTVTTRCTWLQANNISSDVSTYAERIRLYNARSCDPTPALYLHTVVLEKYMDKFTRANIGVLTVVPI